MIGENKQGHVQLKMGLAVDATTSHRDSSYYVKFSASLTASAESSYSVSVESLKNLFKFVEVSLGCERREKKQGKISRNKVRREEVGLIEGW
jgi:hypothetical protein